MRHDSNTGYDDDDDDLKMDEEIDDNNCVKMFCNSVNCSGETIQLVPLEGIVLECPVCYVSLDKVATLTPCFHTFCPTCISRWHSE